MSASHEPRNGEKHEREALGPSRAAWRPFGVEHTGSESWAPRAPGRGGAERGVWRIPTTQSLRKVEDLWPDAAPRPLEAREFEHLMEELRAVPGWAALWEPSDSQPTGWPGVEDWVEGCSGRWRRRGPAARRSPSDPPKAATLLANDWRFGIEGLWSTLIEHLIRGEPLWVQVDSALPELFGDFYQALQRVGADTSGLCPWISDREEALQAVLESGRVSRVLAMGSKEGPRNQSAWEKRLASAPAPRESLRARELPFGFGAAPQSSSIPLHYESCAKVTLRLTKAAAALEPSGHGEDSPVGAWVEASLWETFLTPSAWGGFAHGTPGVWMIAPEHLSEATECLLAHLENQTIGRGALRLGMPKRTSQREPFPLWSPRSSADLEAVQRLALGKGATLLHVGHGSKRRGQDAMLTRQVFTNVKPQTAQALGAWGTPSLALCRAFRGTADARV